MFIAYFTDLFENLKNTQQVLSQIPKLGTRHYTLRLLLFLNYSMIDFNDKSLNLNHDSDRISTGHF